MKIAIVYASETGNTAQIAQPSARDVRAMRLCLRPAAPGRGGGGADLCGLLDGQGHLCPGGKGVFAGTPREAGGPVRHGGFWPVCRCICLSLRPVPGGGAGGKSGVGYLVLSGADAPAVRARYEAQLKEKPATPGWRTCSGPMTRPCPTPTGRTWRMRGPLQPLCWPNKKELRHKGMAL